MRSWLNIFEITSLELNAELKLFITYQNCYNSQLECSQNETIDLVKLQNLSVCKLRSTNWEGQVKC